MGPGGAVICMAPTHPQPDAGRLEIQSSRDDIDMVEKVILEAAQRHGYQDASCFAIRLAVEEALVNAFHHGHRDLPKSTPVSINYQVNPQRICIVIEDQGPGFDVETLPDPTAEENLQRPTGRGVLLIRAYMTRVKFSKNGSRIEMTYEQMSN